MKGFGAINKKLPCIWHGGDYNPDQWIDNPKILEEDIHLMKQAGVNAVTLGVFEWTALEAAEGEFHFEWLDKIMDNLYKNGIYVILATPSAAHPAWMSKKYPDILRTGKNRVRNEHGARVNYCLSSEVYREKCRIIDTALAKRYKNHPALLMWHVGNEPAGECYCEHCRERFREWVKAKYKTLDALNKAWWTAFWSGTYTSWEQVDIPPLIDGFVDKTFEGQYMDFKRFMSILNYECYKNERDAIKSIIPDAVVTTNTWRIFGEMDWKYFVNDIDVAGLDSYPQYHALKDDYKIAQIFSFTYDAYRGMKNGKPFALIETTPSSMLAYHAQSLKRPGIHGLTCMQAIAHGADTVLYFQWRKGRGGCEKNHGAVVGHIGHGDTRVFDEVSQMGKNLSELSDVVGSVTESQAAIVYDPQMLWLEEAQCAYHKTKQSYKAECIRHYSAFWESGVSVDVIHPLDDFSKYKIVVFPMLTMCREGLTKRISEYVYNGGIAVSTYLSFQTDENGLSFTDSEPSGLREVFGICAEELDVLDCGEHIYESWVEDIPPNRTTDRVSLKTEKCGQFLNGSGYYAEAICELIKTDHAQTIMSYDGEFYKGKPAVTANEYGKGKAYYIASRNCRNFYGDFYRELFNDNSINYYILPEGVTVQTREKNNYKKQFVMNFTEEEKNIHIGEEMKIGAYEVKVI